ncbi:MAG TPA: hypothetical protein VF116_12955 [Ktedonobacterales bacterium]
MSQSRQPAPVAAAVMPAVGQLVSQSAYVFKGTIVRDGASNVAIVPASQNAAVVRVDDVLEAIPTLTTYHGKQITIQLREPLPTGGAAVFFANPWIFAENIAVVESGRLPADTDLAALRRELVNARQALADLRLQQVLVSASLVIVGTVTASAMPFEHGSGRAISFHDPLWRAAVVAVRSVEKGKLDAPTVTVVYASSGDRRWFATPKFPPKQEGIYLLHSDQMATVSEPFKVGGLTATNPLDYQPLDQLDRVRRLLKAGIPTQSVPAAAVAGRRTAR